jgi:hypothetical protein
VSPRVQSIALVLLSLALLREGRFIQLDDTSGFGSEEWNMPLGLLALLLAGVSVAVALPDVGARRLLGLVLLVLDGAIVVQAWSNPGFRFIWSGDEGELFQLEVALFIGGLALLTRSVYRPAIHHERTAAGAEAAAASRDLELTGWARFIGYLTATVILVFLAFFAGVAHVEATECSGPDFGGECDLAALGGLVWAAGAIVLATVAVPVLEWSRNARKRRGRT